MTGTKFCNPFIEVIRGRKLAVGVIQGMASDSCAEAILQIPTVSKLYGVVPMDDCERAAPGLSPAEPKLSQFGDRYVHVQQEPSQAASRVLSQIDFVYLESANTYEAAWTALCAWYSKVREGGLIGGCYYQQKGFDGATQAVDHFFRRFEWQIHQAGEDVWWVEKQPLNISFIMPAYNCAGTITESAESIMNGNFCQGDELLIVDDGSTDNTEVVLQELKQRYPDKIKLFKHRFNKGASAARDTAIEESCNPLLFCLDSDNLLVPGSVPGLKVFLEETGADVAYFQNIFYFTGTTDNVNEKWEFSNNVTLADCLAGDNPGASGNYLYTRESWLRAGGYPEFAGALYDTWGFGLRQLATGCKMYGMPNSFYYHRHGHDSYWVRDTEGRSKSVSLRATQLLIPYFDLIDDQDIDYIMGPEGRYTWFANIRKRPIRLHVGGKKEMIWSTSSSYGWAILKGFRQSRLKPILKSLRMGLKPKSLVMLLNGVILGFGVALVFFIRSGYKCRPK